jgi:RNA polymerase sigma-70 factor (sigma-E family)
VPERPTKPSGVAPQRARYLACLYGVLPTAETVEVTSAKARAVDSLAELYIRHAPAGFRLALLLTGDHALAEDLVQDAFVRVVGRLGHVRNAASFDAYLRRTIVNLTKNTWRRRALERAHGAAHAPGADAIEAADGAIIERIEVLDGLRSLSERQRTAIVLRFYEDLPEDEIAAIMGCPTGTVRSLVSRGVAAMRDQIGGAADA